MPGAELMQTPLRDRHVSLGARMVEFAGYRMPVSYDGILAEHRRVRTVAGLFDVSHMGEAEVRGPEAQSFLDYLTTNAVAELEPNRAHYTLLLNRSGGVIDDLILYRLEDRYLVVVNAANVQKDFEWIASHQPEGVDFRSVSEETALLAWQGPKAAEILAPLVEVDLADVPGFGLVKSHLSGVPVVLARTGYTGEDGFEIFLDAADAPAAWDAILAAGEPHGAGPAGLGARDTLRLEKQYRLYGQDMDESVSALEAGLGWVVKLDKGDFLGRDALTKLKGDGVARLSIGLRVDEPGRHIPRAGCDVLAGGEVVGKVTSGTFSPTLEAGIALASVDRAAVKSADFAIRIRDRDAHAVRVRKTFV